MSREKRACQNCKSEFWIESEDFKFYEKIKVPPPTWCPECRMVRRMMFRNEKLLFKKKSAFSGEEIFSMFPADSYPNVYESKIWYSDAWDPTSYGKEVDFSRPFLTQLIELIKEVPHPSRSVSESTLINSDYCNNANDLKNCYLIFNAARVENSAYGDIVYDSKDCMDGLSLRQAELVYDNFWVQKSSRIFFSSNVEDSHDIWFSKNLRGCSNCFGCVNLRNKQYYIFNEPYSREEYKKKLEEFAVGSSEAVEKLKEKIKTFSLRFPRKFMEGRNSVNSRGDYIYNSKNVLNSYNIQGGEDLRYCQFLVDSPNKNCYDQTLFGEGNAFTYECYECGLGTNNIKFCAACWSDVHDLQYCRYCFSSFNLFACIGLRNKSYCILNKQYTKEEYEKLVPKIIEHMNQMPYIDKKGRVYKYGEFFPPELSPFSYNETIAQEYFPLSKDEALAKGYSWKDPEPRNYEITLKTEDLPDHIKDVPDSILNEIIQCAHFGHAMSKCNEQCTEAYKIIPQELQFLRKMNLPLPRLCPNCRHYQRIKQRNPLKLWHRKCMCGGEKSHPSTSSGYSYRNTADHIHHKKEEPCPNEFETTYAPERPEIVYCEQCYLREVV